MVESHDVPAYACECGNTIDACTAANGDGRAPQENDITLCLHCGTPYVFKVDGSIRPMTAQELEELHPAHKAQIHAARTMLRKLLALAGG